MYINQTGIDQKFLKWGRIRDECIYEVQNQKSDKLSHAHDAMKTILAKQNKINQPYKCT